MADAATAVTRLARLLARLVGRTTATANRDRVRTSDHGELSCALATASTTLPDESAEKSPANGLPALEARAADGRSGKRPGDERETLS